MSITAEEERAAWDAYFAEALSSYVPGFAAENPDLAAEGARKAADAGLAVRRKRFGSSEMK